MTAQFRVAVIGAGIAGLACASELSSRGAQVTLFEKHRVPGGRAATRITENGAFDHGAQYFTVQMQRFEKAVQSWLQAGVVQRWDGRLVAFHEKKIFSKTMSLARYVGVPTMNALGKHLAQGLELKVNTRIVSLRREEQRGHVRWWLSDGTNKPLSMLGFDAVAVTLPSPQAAELLQGHTAIAQIAASVQWAPCWSAMLSLRHALDVDFDGAFINDDPILGWVARDSAKPQRGVVAKTAERWVLHANPRWSQKYFEMPAEQAALWLQRSFAARARRPLMTTSVLGRRWRYATPTNPLPQDCLWDAKVALGAAGDWCHGPRIEGAFLSGLALADSIAATALLPAGR